MHTANIVCENILKIKELFPNCIKEFKDSNGELKFGIDFEMLKQELSDEIIESDEKYEFNWPGKKNAILISNSPTNKTLRPCKEESVNWDTTQNLYLEGDNLEILKILRSTYLNKIKIIYIDPPYNTGKDYIYKDNFKESVSEYLAATGQIDDEGNRLFQNKETNGRFHTDWLNMIYPRLKLARDLLSDDGVIFISMDEHEICNLQKLCDEIFGSENFICNFIWQKNSGNNNSKYISVKTEYILCFARQITRLEGKCFFKKKKEGFNDIISLVTLLKESGLSPLEVQSKLREFYVNSTNISNGTKQYKYVDDDYNIFLIDNLGNPSNKAFVNTEYIYELLNPKTGEICKSPKRGWLYKKKDMLKKIEEGKIFFDSKVPRLKRFLVKSEYQNYSSLITNFGLGNKDIEKLFSKQQIFNHPKPVSLIETLIRSSDSKVGIVLDFFSGSATTAHAVMQLNAEDGGNRKFIMVQFPETCNEKSEAFKAGYKNICEIGKERIRRAGKKIIEETGKTDLDIGFRVFKLDSSNMEDTYYLPQEYNLSLIKNKKLYENIKKDRTQEDLLFQVMLQKDFPLSAQIKEEIIDDKRVFSVDGNNLICCFEDNLTEDLITKIISQKLPRIFVTRNNSIDDNVLTNISPIIQVYSPETELEVI